MRTVKKNMYYCDFCKKKSLAAWHMKKHENSCTNNTNRICRLCIISQGSYSLELPRIVADLKARFEIYEDVENELTFLGLSDTVTRVRWVGNPITLDEVKKIADNCPNCILSILRQVGLNRHYFEGFEYDYKKEISLISFNYED